MKLLACMCVYCPPYTLADQLVVPLDEVHAEGRHLSVKIKQIFVTKLTHQIRGLYSILEIDIPFWKSYYFPFLAEMN